MKGDYIQCLQLFIEGMPYRDYMSKSDSSMRVFEFIRERLEAFEEGKQSSEDQGDLTSSTSTATTSRKDSSQLSSQYQEQFRSQIFESFAQLVKFDSTESFKLVN
jgi:hypothetical protein